MIYLYSGTPGSGKSLDVAELVYYKSLHHPVICNFAINLDSKRSSNYFFVDNDDLNPDDLMLFATRYWGNHDVKEDQIYLVIDEAQLLFNSRDWSNKNRRRWLSFFSGHRHFGFCIILACQSDLMLDKQLRYLIEVEVLHRKVNNMGLRGFILRCFTLSPTLFCKVIFYYPMHQKTGSSLCRFKKKFARLYNTHDLTLFKASDRLTLSTAKGKDDQKPIEEKGVCN